MNTEQLEPEADALLRAGKKVANDLSDFQHCILLLLV